MSAFIQGKQAAPGRKPLTEKLNPRYLDSCPHFQRQLSPSSFVLMVGNASPVREKPPETIEQARTQQGQQPRLAATVSPNLFHIYVYTLI